MRRQTVSQGDLYITLVCFENESVVYLTQYTYEILEDITAYAFWGMEYYRQGFGENIF